MTGEPMYSTAKERNGAALPSYINYCLKNKASNFQLCSTHYTAV